MAQLTGNYNAYGQGDTEARSATAQVTLGQIARDAAGNEYRYVKAGAAIAANKACRFQGSALGFDDVRPSDATMQALVGVCGATAFATGEHGWIMRRGIVLVVTTGSVAVGTGLASSATSGGLATVAATDTSPTGAVVLVNSATPQSVYVFAV